MSQLTGTIQGVRHGQPESTDYGQLNVYYVDIVAPNGQQVNGGKLRAKTFEPKVGEEITVKVDASGDPPFLQKVNPEYAGKNGSAPSGGGKGDGKDDAWWYAKDRRISRAGMLQAVVSSGAVQSPAPNEPAINTYVDLCNRVTDALLASLDAHTPHPSSARAGSTPPAQSPPTADGAGEGAVQPAAASGVGGGGEDIPFL